MPAARVAASELESLQPGSLLSLNLAANTLPLWRVSGEPLYEASAIRQGPHRGARIERRLDGEDAR